MNRRIKPTSMGWYLIGLILVLLLLSISYSNNLLLIFALIFLSFSIMWVVESFYTNKDLSKTELALRDFFADDKIRLSLPPEIDFTLSTRSDEFRVLNGELSISQRGHLSFDSVTIKSRRPFGLFEYRETSKISLGIHVYPRRVRGRSGIDESLDTDEPDLTGLTRYQEGNPGRIHWKHYAKTHELVTKEFEGSFAPDVIIEINDNPSEEILSHAAYEIHYAFQNKKNFILKIGKDEISDYTEALQRLALC